MSLTTSPSSPDLGVDLHAPDVSSLSARDDNLILEQFSRHHLPPPGAEAARAR